MSNEIEIQYWNGNILGWNKRKIILNEKEKEIIIKKESTNFTDNNKKRINKFCGKYSN